MRTPHVQDLCRVVWAAREAGTLARDARKISCAIYEAVAADLRDAEVGYDPEEDRRVEWLREVARQRRLLRPQYKPVADAPLEDLMDWMLHGHRERPLCGKELAAHMEVEG